MSEGEARAVASPMRVIGLTGGIASGKSTVAALFDGAGIPVVDADKVAREVVAPGRPAHAAVVQAFGTEILRDDGSIDRPKLGRAVFADASARAKLNAITHPHIRAEIAVRLRNLSRQGTTLAVVDVPLLYETGDPSAYDEVIVVYVDEQTQLERLMARDGLDRVEAERRITAQLPLSQKATLADRVIDNSGTMEQTRAQVREILSIWRARAICGG